MSGTIELIIPRHIAHTMPKSTITDPLALQNLRAQLSTIRNALNRTIING